MNNTIILGIETSCDETSVAVVKNGSEILSNVVSSSIKMHEQTGGIIPEDAARQQIRSIIPVVSSALKTAFGNKNPQEKIDAIAVTDGPGLIGSLLVGVETAKTLSFLWNKPLIPVNHLVAHIYANFLESSENKNSTFPIIGLVVSGGHTDLVLMKNHGKIQLLGSTRDDAAGEVFDKTARLLGLPYPGGPAISKMADSFLSQKPLEKLNLFPRPMAGTSDYDWSFSGLKTSVLNYTKKNEKLDVEMLSAQIQEAIVDVLVEKTLKAVKDYNPKSLFISGGVAANSRLRNRLVAEIKAKKLQVILHVPPVNLCTDNAAPIASAAFYVGSKQSWKNIKANPNLGITD